MAQTSLTQDAIELLRKAFKGAEVPVAVVQAALAVVLCPDTIQ